VCAEVMFASVTELFADSSPELKILLFPDDERNLRNLLMRRYMYG